MSDKQIAAGIVLFFAGAITLVVLLAHADDVRHAADCRAILAIVHTAPDTIAVLRVYPNCTAVLPTPTERR